MGIFDKVKNLFTEEIDEPVREEIRPVSVVPPKPSIEKVEQPVEQPVKEVVKEEKKPTREEKFVYFTDDDFKDLDKPKKEEVKKVEKKVEPKPLAYKGASITVNQQPEPKKEFKPSPIISPVYGVLDKNYDKEDIKPKSKPTVYRSSTITIDDVRNKAYGTVEDEIKDDILGKALIEQTEEKVVEPDINIFEELDKYGEDLPKNNNVDDIFGKLDIKKDEILDELDEKKDEILGEIDNKTNSIDILSKEFNDIDDDLDIEESVQKTNDVDITKEFLDDIDDEIATTRDDVEEAKELSDDEETLALARELEEQKKKLNEINNMMDENKKTTKTKSKKKKEKVENEEDNLNESELFDIIDSSYEKDDE